VLYATLSLLLQGGATLFLKYRFRQIFITFCEERGRGLEFYKIEAVRLLGGKLPHGVKSCFCYHFTK
jgi:hypothetical protein